MAGTNAAPKCETLPEALLDSPKYDNDIKIYFERNLKNVVAPVGHDVLLQCKVLGEEPECTWYRNGKPITRDPRIKVTSSIHWHKLLIRRVAISDTGIYTILCKNRHSYAKSQSALYVQMKKSYNHMRGALYLPRPHSKLNIVKHLKNITITAGDPLCLKVVLNERTKDKLQMEWFFNDRPMGAREHDYNITEDATSSELCKYGAEVSDSGIYTVVVTYFDIALSSTSEVLVMAPMCEPLPFHVCPSFITYFPEEVEVYESEEVLLTCKIYADDFTQVTWKKDNTALDRRNVLCEDYGGRVVGIRILNAQICDTGVYEVVLSNELNKLVTTEQCILKVNKRSQEEIRALVGVKQHLKIVLATLGATVVLHCAFFFPESQVFYVVWRIGLYTVERSSSNFEVVRSGTNFLVIIRNLEPDMLGEVACTLHWQSPNKKTPAQMAITKGLLVHLPPDAMMDAKQEDSYIVIPRLFAEIVEENTKISWKTGFKHPDLETSASSLSAMSALVDGQDLKFIDDCTHEEAELPSESKDLQQPGPSKITTTVPPEDESEIFVELIYCRLDAAKIHYLMIQNCEDDLKLIAETKSGYYYDDAEAENIHLQIIWRRRPTLMSDLWYAVDMADLGNEYSQIGLTTIPQVTIENPTPGTLYKIRVRLVKATTGNIKECSFIVTPPKPEQTYYVEDVLSLPLSEFERKYSKSGEPIGVGAYGSVYVVTDEAGKFYAAKVVKTRTDKRRVSTRRELEIMRNLKHRRIVPLVASFYSRDECILVMEQLWGGELFQRIFEEDHFEERTAVHYIRQLCEGLEYLHDMQIVHLDMKPENVVCVSRNNRDIKIVDFGLSRMLEQSNMRAIYGTRDYIAPEVLNFEPLSTYCDMWSLGVVTYVMLSGLVPFTGSTWHVRAANITRGDYDYDDPAFDSVSNDAKDFINSLLVRRPQERLTASQARSHRWVKEGPAVDVGIGQTRRWKTNLKTYLEINRARWHQAGNVVMAANRLLIGVNREINSRPVTT